MLKPRILIRLCLISSLSLALNFSWAAERQNEKEINFATDNTFVRTWDEIDANGIVTPYYEISLDGRGIMRKADHTIRLRHGNFNPSASVPPPLFEHLASGPEQNLYIVQYVTQILPQYRQGLMELGATPRYFMPSNGQIVHMSAAAKQAVEALPYVRWVGPYHPAYRLEEYMLHNATRGKTTFPLLRYNLMIMDSEKDVKAAVAKRIEKLGGTVQRAHAGKYLMEVTLTDEQLFDVAGWDEVLFIDRWSPGEADMDNAREIGGANYIETMEGWTGQGVRGEILDLGFNMTHVDFDHHPLIAHTLVNSDSHGAACSGINFGDGTGNPDARGMLPDGQGIVADWDEVSVGTPRYDHTGELIQDPYNAVFQTSSVGSARTLDYSTISVDTDAALFDFDIVHCQSQSNAGDQMSRPQAWAKNIISGGAVNHRDTLDRSDDCWCGGASIGPATDGRIKPDLASFYDATLTTTTGSTTAYTPSFGGTSGATPIICGHVGLFYQMWSEGTFGNDVTPGATVFENRSHMTTAKAMLINTAYRYDFSGQAHDMTRVHQGWGMPDLAKLYDQRESIIVVDEEDILVPLATASYSAHVTAGAPELSVTMIFADPPGNPGATMHRINNLDLIVTSPSGTVYYGNNGLLDGNWSTPMGVANEVDTVENVFIQDPEVGEWSVDVFAAEINEDGHVETGALDADFALVVTGAVRGPGFSLAASPNDLEICSPADAGFELTIGQQLGYSNEITLSATGVNGASVSFSQNPVTPPAVVTVTVGNTGGITPGNHSLSITGTASDSTKVTFLNVNVSDTVPPGPLNIQPGDTATEQALFPMLTWDPAAQASTYDVQLASDSAFANLIVDETVTTNSYEVDTRLDQLTCYYWRVRAANGCGDGVWSGAGFTTQDQADYFTEAFGSGSDLEGMTVRFIPNGSGNYYDFCVEATGALPTNPAGGTTVTLTDDSFQTIIPAQPVNLYGTPYSSLFLGSNGFITFGSGDSATSGSLGNHFNQARISMVFDDLNPAVQGTVSYRETGDRIALTFENVPQYNGSDNNTFQYELLHNGEIHLTWLVLGSADHLVGLSRGGGVPGDFLASDFSGGASCAVRPAAALGDGCSLVDCIGDLTGNGTVDNDDLYQCASGWTTQTGDVNGDGIVNIFDMMQIMDAFGACR